MSIRIVLSVHTVLLIWLYELYVLLRCGHVVWVLDVRLYTNCMYYSVVDMWCGC